MQYCSWGGPGLVLGRGENSFDTHTSHLTPSGVELHTALQPSKRLLSKHHTRTRTPTPPPPLPIHPPKKDNNITIKYGTQKLKTPNRVSMESYPLWIPSLFWMVFSILPTCLVSYYTPNPKPPNPEHLCPGSICTLVQQPAPNFKLMACDWVKNIGTRSFIAV